MESYNDNYIYIYFVTNQHQFYFKYNRSGSHIQSKKLKINNYGKIKVDDIYISPFQYFDIYIYNIIIKMYIIIYAL